MLPLSFPRPVVYVFEHPATLPTCLTLPGRTHSQVADGNFNRYLAWSERRRASGIRSRLPWFGAQDDAHVQIGSLLVLFTVSR